MTALLFPVGRVEILRDVKLNDDDFQEDWTVNGGTFVTDSENAIITIVVGSSTAQATKPCNFNSSIHRYATINCVSLDADLWQFQVRRAADQTWLAAATFIDAGRKTVDVSTVFAGEIDMIRLTVAGDENDHAMFDYVIVSGKTVLAPTDDLDMLELRVHLGVVEEVGSFELTMQNFNAKYTSQVGVGDHVKMWLGRTNGETPKVFTGRVEEVEFNSTTVENYVTLRGRDKGEELFRRVATKTYQNMKAEAVVKDLIETYTGLKHVRGDTELVETTDTTFTFLQYENTPVFDILKEVAKSSVKSGMMGFDFRVEPDGKFAFFPRNSKTSQTSLSESIEISGYRKDIHRIRNKITVYGAAEKAYPTDKDFFTESLLSALHLWQSGTGTGNVYVDASTKIKGAVGVRHATEQNDYYGRAVLTLTSPVDSALYPSLNFYLRLQPAFSGEVSVRMVDNNGNSMGKWLQLPTDKWMFVSFRIGDENADEWQVFDLPNPPFNWSQIKQVWVTAYFAGTGMGNFWIDNLFFNHRRWSASAEDYTSQSSYGLRELVEVDEELHADEECTRKAQALLNHLRMPAEYLTVQSDIVDYGNAPILAGDKIHVTLPNESIDADYHVSSIEYHATAKDQTLKTTIELGKEPPLVANVVSVLRSKTEALTRTKAGSTTMGGTGGAGSGGEVTPHGDSVHTQFNEVDIASTDTAKNKHISNALAKAWEDHKNATKPHNEHASKPHGNTEHSETYITRDGNARVKIQKNETDIGTRRAINFKQGNNVTLAIIDDAANEKVDVEIAASGVPGSAEQFNIPVYLGDSMFVANKVLSGSGAALGQTQYFTVRSTIGTSAETRGFYPQFRHCGFQVKAVKYERQKADASAYVRVYIDKIAPDGAATNLWDSGETEVIEDDWALVTHDLSANPLQLSREDVLRVKIYLKIITGETGGGLYTRGFRLECEEATT